MGANGAAANGTGRTGGPATVYAWVVGVTFVVVGVWGFVETGFGDWTAPDPGTAVLWFQVNPLHNLVHLLVGGGLIAAALRSDYTAMLVTLLVGIVYVVVGFGGFWATGEDWNLLALNRADNWLHLVTAALAFAAVIASDRRRSTGPVPG